MHTASTTRKYRYRIRTRHGLLVENLVIHGRDEADAQRKLRQMYRQCQVMECITVGAHRNSGDVSFEEVVSLLTK